MTTAFFSMKKPIKQHRPKDLTTEVHELRNVVHTAYFVFRRESQTRRQLAMAFLKGVATALGALVTVIIITPFIVWSLQRIAWPPLIAEIVARVILQYEQANPQSQQEAVDQ
jgi:hypothetical protein